MTLWFLARAAGFTALLAATAAVCLGALTAGSSPATRARRAGSRALLQVAHRSAAVVTLALLLLHATLLVLDRHVSITPAGALVPFTAGYRGVALGLGTLAAYCFAVVVLTGALRGRMAAPARTARWWRPLHLLAYGAWPLALGHGLLAGTDTTTRWAWVLYATSIGAVVVAVGARVRAEVRHASGPLTVRRRAARRQAPIAPAGPIGDLTGGDLTSGDLTSTGRPS